MNEEYENAEKEKIPSEEFSSNPKESPQLTDDMFEDFLNSMDIDGNIVTPQKVEQVAENPSIPQETKEEIFESTPMEKEVQQLQDGDKRTNEVSNQAAEKTADIFEDFLSRIDDEGSVGAFVADPSQFLKKEEGKKETSDDDFDSFLKEVEQKEGWFAEPVKEEQKEEPKEFDDFLKEVEEEQKSSRVVDGIDLNPFYDAIDKLPPDARQDVITWYEKTNATESKALSSDEIWRLAENAEQHGQDLTETLNDLKAGNRGLGSHEVNFSDPKEVVQGNFQNVIDQLEKNPEEFLKEVRKDLSSMGYRTSGENNDEEEYILKKSEIGSGRQLDREIVKTLAQARGKRLPKGTQMQRALGAIRRGNVEEAVKYMQNSSKGPSKNAQEKLESLKKQRADLNEKAGAVKKLDDFVERGILSHKEALDILNGTDIESKMEELEKKAKEEEKEYKESLKKEKKSEESIKTEEKKEERKPNYEGVDFGDDIFFDDGRYGMDSFTSDIEKEVKKEKESKKRKLKIAPLHSSIWNPLPVGVKGKALDSGSGVSTVEGKHGDIPTPSNARSHVSTKSFHASGGGGKHSFGGVSTAAVPKRKTIAQHGGYGGKKYEGADRANVGGGANTGMTIPKTMGSFSSAPTQKHTSFDVKRKVLKGSEGHTKASVGKGMAKAVKEDLKIRLLRDSIHWPTFKTSSGKEIKRTTKYTPLTLSKVEDDILVGRHTIENATPEEEAILRRSI